MQRKDAMSNVMIYQGYSARIDCDDKGGIYFGGLACITDGVGSHADTVGGLEGPPARPWTTT